MLTSKQRARLRAMANSIPALYQIGKDGITETMIEQFNLALEAKELIKVHVLENAMMDVREAAETVAQKTGAQTVQMIGSKFVLYKQSKENPVIQL
ncbi:ribosome assembly RNA-binding protein YhbY [Ructibacterium gallinarum]|uniref:Ribosome assembly RNA-binding protein YhbY n=1 Tax=Ructibacterium gallinarum TaxID=2779355 RepID=A0A9D5RAS5_9FIRM|nr:ribosome assembly RNA-binding protein YhbY [Ructibacterium gallinarum]MBE5039373.1 ribosome assembly RNA-binding protein YhbY [Ructibacterium gallinarum]